MKILSISAFYSAKTPPTGYGGMERFIHSLNESLVQDHDQDVTTLCPVGSVGGSYKTICCINSELPEETRSLIKKFNPDIVHNHMRDFALYKAFEAPVPVLTTIHSNIRNSSYWIPIIKEKKENEYFSTISPTHNERLMHALDANGINIHDNNFYMAGYGLDIKDYLKHKKVSNSGDYYIYIGAIAPYKGVLDIALEFSKIGKELLIVGPCTNENERSYFQEVMKIVETHKNIKYFGETSSDFEKICLLKRAKGLVIASGYSAYDYDYYEAFGLVMLEANAVGVPVIGFNKGNIRDYIVDGLNGYTFDNLNEIEEILKKIDKQNFVSGSIKRAGEFEISKIARGYLNMFQKIVGDYESNSR